MSETLSESELSPRDPSGTGNAAQDESFPDHASPSQTQDNLRPITPRRQAFILLSSFLTICITIGFNQSYGVFQSYYTSPGQTLLPEDAQDQSAWIAFVGTLGAGLTWGGSIVINPLMARVRDVRWLTVTGVVCMSAGFGLASFGREVSLTFWGVTPFPLLELISIMMIQISELSSISYLFYFRAAS
jgi:hypothetical protein